MPDATSRSRKIRLLRSFSLALAVVLFAALPGMAQNVAPSSGGTIDASAIEAFAQDRPDADVEGLRRLYEARGFRPAWSGGPEEEARVGLVRETLVRAGEDGLDPDAYLVAASQDELAITDALLRYMRDLRLGRVLPAHVGGLIELPPQDFDPVAALSEALSTDDLERLVADLPPPHADYVLLKGQLARYREIEARGGWPAIPAETEIVLSDAEETRLPLLRERLDIELADFAALAVDDDLEPAVRAYQSRNGLAVDGRVGPRTLAMLNIAVSRRVKQIVANMERWRWLPRSFERRYVVVNIPDAMLDVLANGQVVLSSRVIVGRPITPTPVFRAEIVGITANPPWNVPASIARNEMLPLLRGDPMYLADRNMILVNGPEGDPHGLTIEWNTVERTAFPYQIRQLPGPDNALGRIKFELPNRFSVYLHDTPARNLFARMERFFSHGCIRVEEVAPIASYLLDGGTEAPESFERALDGDETVLLPLEEAVPVYILYLTAVRNRDGTFGFRHDIYGEDEEFIAMLAGRAASSFTALAADFGCPAAG